MTECLSQTFPTVLNRPTSVKSTEEEERKPKKKQTLFLSARRGDNGTDQVSDGDRICLDGVQG